MDGLRSNDGNELPESRCVFREVRMLEYVAIGFMVVLATLVALIAIGLGSIFGPKKASAAKAMRN